MYVMLYGQEENWDLINKSVPQFFEDLDHLLFDYFILALSRLADPPEQRVKKDIAPNFTLEQLMLQLDKTAHAVLIHKLEPMLNDYKRKCLAIRERRMKWVAHTDYKTKMEPGTHPLPDVSRKIIEEALTAAEDYLNHFENHFSGADCEPYRDFSSDSADILLDRLSKAVAYDKLVATGRIDPGYLHALANTPS